MGQAAVKHRTGAAERARATSTGKTQAAELPGAGRADESAYLSRT